jgi:glycosyltransferase involved in cell wall biosynthesis
VRLLYLTDRLSDRGGADHHLIQVMSDAVTVGHRVEVGFGRDEGGPQLPETVARRRFAGLASRVASSAKLGDLDDVIADAEIVHLQNVMNPVVLEMAAAHPRAVVTVQDHRVFCPGPGKTLPDGRPCAEVMGDRVCRGCLPDRGYRRATLELTTRRLEALRAMTVVVLSRYMAGELAAVGVEGATIIPPWVKPGGSGSASGSRILIAGRLVAHKGITDAWRAWNRAGRPLPLEVAGAGPVESELRGAALLGWLPPDELRAAIRRARMLLFPARWQEPFGILGVEALAEGTPVVVAACGGTNDWSDAGCVRVAPGDVDAMADAVARLSADGDAASAMGRRGRAAVAERFSEERIPPLLEELYRKIFEA